MEPRFQKHLKNDKPFFASKLFQVQMSSFFQQRNENLPIQFFAETYYLVVSNAALLGWYFSRSGLVTLFTTCYASLIVLTYGHSVDFHKALKYDFPQSIYTRLQYREQFGQNQYDDTNAKFIKRFQL